MTRDMELIRTLLLRIDTDPRLDGMSSLFVQNTEELGITGHSMPEVAYHIRLLIEADFIKGNPNVAGGMPAIVRLTWNGHEFLDDVRDPDVLVQNQRTGGNGGGVALAFVWEIAKAELKKNFISNKTGSGCMGRQPHTVRVYPQVARRNLLMLFGGVFVIQTSVLRLWSTDFRRPSWFCNDVCIVGKQFVAIFVMWFSAVSTRVSALVKNRETLHASRHSAGQPIRLECDAAQSTIAPSVKRCCSLHVLLLEQRVMDLGQSAYLLRCMPTLNPTRRQLVSMRVSDGVPSNSCPMT